MSDPDPVMSCSRCGRRFGSARALGSHRGRSSSCRETDAELLDRKVPYREPGKCWLWGGHVNVKGYGTLTRDGRHWGAHHWVRFVLYGETSPGLDLHHLCEERLCVNPDHLVPLDRQDHNDITHGRRDSTLVLIEAGHMPVPY